MGISETSKNTFEKQLENAQSFFEMQLQKLQLGEKHINDQTLEELERSLERINEAIQNPSAFGTIKLSVTADAGMIIAMAKSESHFEIGILPLLLERKKLILERLDSLKENVREQILSTKPSEIVADAISIVPTFPIPTPAKMMQYQCDVFVIMPFAEDFTAVHTDVVKPVGEELGLVVKRGDDFFANNYIMDEVWFGIYYAKLVVADCTGRNPNVFYELGIAHTLGKPAILLTQNVDDIPFDVAGRRFIEYQDKLSSLREMKTQLRTAITTIIKGSRDE